MVGLSKKNAKRVAMAAVLGVTGLTVLGIINLYRLNKDLPPFDLSGEDWWGV